MKNERKYKMMLRSSGCLILAIIILKILNIISISWIALTSPIWVPLILIAVLSLLGYLIFEVLYYFL